MSTDSIARPAASLKFFGFGLALVWFLLDQATKWWVLEAMSPAAEIRITSFFNLVLAWNNGISFGMLARHGLPPWTLALLSGIIVVVLGIWLWRTRDRLTATSLALIIGGALGNALDRLRHGAVTDFLDFHWVDWHWPAFNMADVGVLCGCALLIVDGLIRRDSDAA
jgi:signal peptidase II